MKDPVSIPQFAEQTINNTLGMINNLANLSDGTPRNLDSTVTAGILVAQSNLAVASALMTVAYAIKGGPLS